MSDMPEKIWANNGYKWYDFDDGIILPETIYIRADLVNAIRQQALADALAAVDYEGSKHENGWDEWSAGYRVAAESMRAAIRRLMQQKARRNENK